MHHNIKNSTNIFADKWIEAKMVDDDIQKMLDRLNALIEFNIAIARFRLAMMSLEVNKFMKMTNGNCRLKIYYQNIPGTLSKQNMLTTIESLLSRNKSISCLDHIYVRDMTDIISVKNMNETGYDHSCVGAEVNVSNSNA